MGPAIRVESVARRLRLRWPPIPALRLLAQSSIDWSGHRPWQRPALNWCNRRDHSVWSSRPRAASTRRRGMFAVQAPPSWTSSGTTSWIAASLTPSNLSSPTNGNDEKHGRLEERQGGRVPVTLGSLLISMAVHSAGRCGEFGDLALALAGPGSDGTIPGRRG